MSLPSSLPRFLEEWFSHHEDILTSLIFTGIVVATVWAINTASRPAFRALLRHIAKKESLWLAPVIEAARRPFRWAIRLVGLTILAGYLMENYTLPLVGRFFPPLRDIAVIATLLWFTLGAVARTEVRLQSGGQRADPTAVDAISKLVRISLVLVAVLMAMPVLGFSISGILAFGGIGGIAIGFAAQGLVANLLGGLTIYASRPFNVGEYIIMPGTEVQGEVQEIGWRATRVMGFDKRPAYVPNALFNTAIVINFTRMRARRIQEYIHIRYEDLEKVPEIVAEVTAMLATHPGIFQDFFTFHLDTCANFAARMELYLFTPDKGYVTFMETKEDLLLRIVAIIRSHGADIAPSNTAIVKSTPL